jgi:DNA-binding winged helix-turn-helix (wHTH) protein
MARTKAILARSRQREHPLLSASDLVLDPVHHSVTRGGKPVQLTQREFDLLRFLLENKNRVLSRANIIESVWGYAFDPGTNVVDVHISYLRNAIDRDFEKKLIHSVRGEGFMLRDDTTTLQPPTNFLLGTRDIPFPSHPRSLKNKKFLILPFRFLLCLAGFREYLPIFGDFVVGDFHGPAGERGLKVKRNAGFSFARQP